MNNSKVIHELKITSIPFMAILDGTKTHEYRKNDRQFKVGDYLRLREFIPCPECNGTGRIWDSGDKMDCCYCNDVFGTYTGAEISTVITYITDCAVYGGPEGFVCLSIDVAIPEKLNIEINNKKLSRAIRAIIPHLNSCKECYMNGNSEAYGLCNDCLSYATDIAIDVHRAINYRNNI